MTDHMTPIYIGGLGTSGKTPVRRVLEAHPEIVMTRRTYLWTRLYGQFGPLRDPVNRDRCLAALAADTAAAALAPDVERLRADLDQGSATYARLFMLVHAHHAERLGARRWGEQLGGIERYADTILSEAPAARMVHMLRRPWTDDLGRPGRRRGGWATEAMQWCGSVSLARRNRARHPDAYMVVEVEDLVARPRHTLDELCRFLDEDVHPAMLRMLGQVCREAPGAAPTGFPATARAEEAS